MKHNSICGIEREVQDSIETFLWAILGDTYKKELLDKDKVYYMTAIRFAEITNVSESTAYSALKEVADKLLTVRHEQSISDDHYMKYPILAQAHYHEKEGKIGVKFNETAIPLLSGFTDGNYTTLCGELAASSCKYSKFLYEVFKKNLFRKSVTLSLEKLRDILVLDKGKYKATGDIIAYIIKPSLKDIEFYTDLHVTYELAKVGRKVTGFIFKIVRKQQTFIIGETK